MKTTKKLIFFHITCLLITCFQSFGQEKKWVIANIKTTDYNEKITNYDLKLNYKGDVVRGKYSKDKSVKRFFNMQNCEVFYNNMGFYNNEKTVDIIIDKGTYNQKNRYILDENKRIKEHRILTNFNNLYKLDQEYKTKLYKYNKEGNLESIYLDNKPLFTVSYIDGNPVSIKYDVESQNINSKEKADYEYYEDAFPSNFWFEYFNAPLKYTMGLNFGKTPKNLLKKISYNDKRTIDFRYEKDANGNIIKEFITFSGWYDGTKNYTIEFTYAEF